MSQNGGHHAIRRRKLPLESDLPTFFGNPNFFRPLRRLRKLQGKLTLINVSKLVLDQFLTRNHMVQLPGAHSHVIAIFGNQTYLTALAQSWHSGHAVHSFRGTFTITTGVNVVVIA